MSKKKKLSKSKSKAEGVREKLIRAAIHDFSLHGFDGASTREIAAAAEENLGLIAYYFTNKETLWREAVGHLLAENVAELGRWVAEAPTGDSKARARHILMNYVRYIARRPELMRIMSHEAGKENSRVDWIVDQHLKPAYEILRPIIEQFIEAGRLPQAPAYHIVYFIIGAAGTIFATAPGFRQQTGADPTAEAFIETHARLTVDWLIGE